jgi:hypothetical protein
MNCIVLVVYGILICFSSYDDKGISCTERAIGGSLVILPGIVEGGKALVKDGGIDEDVAHLGACLNGRRISGREVSIEGGESESMAQRLRSRELWT